VQGFTAMHNLSQEKCTVNFHNNCISLHWGLLSDGVQITFFFVEEIPSNRIVVNILFKAYSDVRKIDYKNGYEHINYADLPNIRLPPWLKATIQDYL